MSSTKAIKLAAVEAERLRGLAVDAEVSVSQLVSDALAEAVANGLGRRTVPLAAGPKVIGPRLDDELIAAAAGEAAECGLSFSAYARAALGAYLALLEELGGGEPGAGYEDEPDDDDEPESVDDDEWEQAEPGLVERAAAAVVHKAADVLERPARPTEPAPRDRPKRRPAALSVVDGCLHVTREAPDEAGYVDCEECGGRRAQVLPPDSPEVALVLERERTRRAAMSSGSVLLACGHRADPPLPDYCLRCGRYAKAADERPARELHRDQAERLAALEPKPRRSGPVKRSRLARLLLPARPPRVT